MNDGILVGVINHGVGPNVPWPPRRTGRPVLMVPVWKYGGKDYTYEASIPGEKPIFNIVPMEIAYFHWAVEPDPMTGEIRRCTVPVGDDDPWFDNRLSGLCPKIEVKRFPDEPFDERYNPLYRTNDPAWVDWYTNGVTFKMKRISARMTAEEFLR